VATLRLIFKEIAHRKINFLLSLLSVLTAVVLFVAFVTTAKGYRRETRRIMRNMGQNLRIIPEQTPIDEFWSVGFSEHTMPEEYVHRFAALQGFSYTHLTATLQKKAFWRGMNVVLTGILPEVLPIDKRNQAPMVLPVEAGTVHVGFEVADGLGIKEGDEVDLLGKTFNVVKCLSQTGSSDDIRIYGHLHDVQAVLNLEGRINEIKALECLCIIESSKVPIDPLELAEKQLAQILPEAKVVLLQGIAAIRQQQRQVTEGYLAFLMPTILVVCGAWVGALAIINVRDRRTEIGIMRALGHSSARIVALFLGKALVIGLFAALGGFFVGVALALGFSPRIFEITSEAIRPEYALLAWFLIAAPLFAAVSSFIPAVLAATQDPAVTLRQQ
jgi:ABC-type lipoprotein release transport system permease subunit